MSDRDHQRQRRGESASEHNMGPLAPLVSVGVALRAQQLITRGDHLWTGAILYAIAAGLFSWGVSTWSGLGSWIPQDYHPPQPHPADDRKQILKRVGLMLATLGLSSGAFFGVSDNRFSILGIATWVGAITAFLIAVAGGDVPSGLIRQLQRGLDELRDARRERPLRIRVGATALLLGLIVGTGIFFRLYRLPNVPVEMTSDHAEKLLDVHDVLQGARPVFFPRNTGREAFQFYLTAALIRLTPLTISHLALKVGTVLVSAITIPLAFFLGQVIYGRRVGLLTAGFVAVSRWHVAISRVGLRFPFTPLFATLVLAFLFRAFRHNRRRDWLLCGLTLGFGLHTYTAVRILPLLLVVLVLCKTACDLIDRARATGSTSALGSRPYAESSALDPAFWLNAAWGAAAAGLVFLPLLRYMTEDPSMFWFRASSRLTEVEQALPTAPWRALAANMVDALLMFNYEGCPVWVNTVPGDPALSPVVGPLFVLGAALLLWQVIRHRDRRALYVLASLLVLLLPSALSIAFPEENPSAVRAGGTIPIAALMVALATDGVSRSALRLLPTHRKAAQVLVPAILLVSAAYLTYTWYFVTYDRQYRGVAWNATEMAQVVRSFGDKEGGLEHAYHIPYRRWVDPRLIAIGAGDITWDNLVQDLDQLRDHAKDGEPKLYLLHVNDRESIRALRAHLPRGRLELYRSPVPNRDFLVYHVPAAN